MTVDLFLDIAATVFAAVSALFWALSARVDFPVGFDMGAQQKEAMQKASALNARGAAFAALAVLMGAIKTFLGVYPHLM